MGRRSRLTPERQASIVRYIRQGCTQRVAALASGIGESTLYEWLKKGQKARSGAYRELWLAVETAKGEAEAKLVVRIQTAAKAPRNWKAAAWLLERRNPAEWGPRMKIEATVAATVSPEAVRTVATMSPEQLKALSGVDLDEMDGMSLPTASPATTGEPDTQDG